MSVDGVLTSIVIVTCNGLDLTRKCLDSVQQFTAGSFEVIVVDNGSTDGTREFLFKRDGIRLILNSANRGFPAACNSGAATSRGKYLAFLNNDMVVAPRWLANMQRCLEVTEAGMVGPMCDRISGMQFLPAEIGSYDEAVSFGQEFNVSNPAKWRPTVRIGGSPMLIAKDLYERLGGFDEVYTPGNFEDDDLCMKVGCDGRRIYIAGDTFVHHSKGGAFSKDTDSYAKIMDINARSFCEKWSLDHPLVTYPQLQVLKLTGVARKRVLDVKCRTGATLLECLIKGSDSVTGVEANPRLQKIAATHISGQQCGGVYPAIDAIPAGERFDLIISLFNLETLKAPRAYLSRLKALISPGGRLVGAVRNQWGLQRCVYSLLGAELLTYPRPMNSSAASLSQVLGWLQSEGWTLSALAFDGVPDSGMPAAEDLLDLCQKHMGDRFRREFYSEEIWFTAEPSKARAESLQMSPSMARLPADASPPSTDKS